MNYTDYNDYEVLYDFDEAEVESDSRLPQAAPCG